MHVATLEAVQASAPRAATARATLADVACLTKARLNALVSLTAVAAAALAPAPAWGPAALAALGATLAALGACALNQVLERERDARMDRTRGRPLPSGRLGARAATALALGLLAAGGALAGCAGPAPLVLTALGAVLYALVYTPLKARTPLAFIPGAASGALPPLVGWTAAGGELDGTAALLAALLLAWQVPHVAAIDWVHRDDHRRGGLRTLAVVAPGGGASAAAALLGAAALVATATALGHAQGGLPAAAACALLGAPVLHGAAALARSRATHAARHLFRTTLVQLPLVLLVAIVAARL